MKNYNITIWKDHVVDGETIIQQGTPMNANTFNNMEEGVFESIELGNVILQQVIQNKRNVVDLDGEMNNMASMNAAKFNSIEEDIFESIELGNVILQQVIQDKRNIADLEGEIKDVALTNTLAYPFTNSAKTVSLSKSRDTTNYRVVTEIVSTDGAVEDIEVYDKQLNGFKVKYIGSAKNVTIKCFIQGGMR